MDEGWRQRWFLIMHHLALPGWKPVLAQAKNTGLTSYLKNTVTPILGIVNLYGLMGFFPDVPQEFEVPGWFGFDSRDGACFGLVLLNADVTIAVCGRAIILIGQTSLFQAMFCRHCIRHQLYPVPLAERVIMGYLMFTVVFCWNSISPYRAGNGAEEP